MTVRFATLDLTGVPDATEAGARLAVACGSARRVHVRADPHRVRNPNFWRDMLTKAGRVVPVDEDARTGRPTGHIWSEVRYDPAGPITFRHSSAAQPLHTDGAYLPRPPEFVILVCARAAPRGGATLFLDGNDLVSWLIAQAPDLLADLRSCPMRFAKGSSTVTAPVIAEGADGPLLRWNHYALAPDLAPAARAVADRFQALLLGRASAELADAHTLRVGEAVVFADARMLHGRESFTASLAGDRLLWKGGFDSFGAS